MPIVAAVQSTASGHPLFACLRQQPHTFVSDGENRKAGRFASHLPMDPVDLQTAA
jgi:hypothetical protein